LTNGKPLASPTTIDYRLSTIDYRLSTIDYRLSTIDYFVGERRYAAGAAEGGEGQRRAAAVYAEDDGDRGYGEGNETGHEPSFMGRLF